MLSLAYEKYPNDICFTLLPKTLVQIYTENNEEKSLDNASELESSEVRYLPHLRRNVESLLVTLLSDINITNSTGLLREMLYSPHALADILFKYKNELLELKLQPQTVPSIEDISPLEIVNNNDGRQTSTLQDLDQEILMMKSQGEGSEWEYLKEKLRRVQVLCEKICEFVENCEDLIIPFSVCFKFEVLANECREEIEAM